MVIMWLYIIATLGIGILIGAAAVTAIIFCVDRAAVYDILFRR